MPKNGSKRKKSRTHVADSGALTADERKLPKSLVTRRGKTAIEVGELVSDMRRLMQPYTAVNFQDDPKNRKLTLQQYCTNLALPMGITHIMQFSQKEDRCNMRLARMPEGPTLSFRLHKFSLTRHIQALQKRPVAFTSSLTSHSPVVVTNNFGDHTAAPHIKLLRITFQNLFPQINVSTVKLKDCRRVVLFNLEEVTDKESGEVRQLVEMRHYAVKATPVGINRRVRRLVQAKLPNLHQCQDIADYLTGHAMSDGGAASDSEPEDDPAFTVQLSDRYVGKGNAAKQKSALKLVELGPRLQLQLIKVEKTLDNASPTLYHAFVTKTPEEVSALQAKKDKEIALKQQRKMIQDRNVERKRSLADEKRTAKKQRQAEREVQHSVLEEKIEGVSSSSDSSDDEEDED